jgi:DNA-binding ferritin-like protein (Dps family)
MSFEDIVAVLGQAFSMELKVVQDTTVFEVVSDDGSTKVQILLQDTGERNLVLLSADLGEVPPEGREKLFQTMLEANNMFSGTVGSTLALDAILVNRVRDVFHHTAAEGDKVLLDKTAALCDKLYEDISQVLNKTRSSLKDVVDKNIEDMGKTDANKELQEQLDKNADDLPPLNINQLTDFDV